MRLITDSGGVMFSGCLSVCACMHHTSICILTPASCTADLRCLTKYAHLLVKSNDNVSNKTVLLVDGLRLSVLLVRSTTHGSVMHDALIVYMYTCIYCWLWMVVRDTCKPSVCLSVYTYVANVCPVTCCLLCCLSRWWLLTLLTLHHHAYLTLHNWTKLWHQGRRKQFEHGSDAPVWHNAQWYAYITCPRVLV